MKTGKGGKAAAPASPQKKAPAAASKSAPAASPKPAAVVEKRPAGKPTAAKASGPTDDDDPFGIHAATISRAVPLSPRPMKGKTTKFTCPMCETVGFGGAEFAGKEVKCCNEKCPLPIFTAPKSDTGTATANQHPMGATQSAKPKASSLPLIVMAVLAMGGAGGSVWYFLIRDPNAGSKPAPPPATVTLSVNTTLNNKEEKQSEVVVEKSPAEVAAELRGRILPNIVEWSRKSEFNRMPVCRRLAAEAYIEAGDVKAAQENLDQLSKVAAKFPYHQARPLVHLAWRDQILGNEAEAKQAAARAVTASKDLPDESRLTFDTRTDLAALLVVHKQTDDAAGLMNGNLLPPGSLGQLPVLIRRAQLTGSFDLNESATSLPVIPWKSPQWVMTTVTLVLRGYSDQALKWAKLAPNLEAQAECFSAWGDAVVFAGKSDVATDEAIQSAIGKESPAICSRVWARVATARLAKQQKEAAGKSLTHAIAAVKQLSAPTDFVMPELRELMRFQLKEAPAARTNAISVAEVARAQAMLGDNRAAGETLNAALQHVRGDAPSQFLTSRRYEEISREADAVKTRLKSELDLKTTDQVQTAVVNYRAKLRSLLDAANARHTVQTEILKSAVDWPLLDAVWAAAVARDEDSTPDESREQFLKTNLAVRLAARLHTAGKTELARRCDAAVTAGNLTDQRDNIERETLLAIEKDEVSKIVSRLVKHQVKNDKGQLVIEDEDWPLMWMLRLATRLAKNGSSDKAFDLVASIPDKQTVWREDGYLMLGALVAKSPKDAESVWTKHRDTLMPATEKVAMFRGLCIGLSRLIDAKE